MANTEENQRENVMEVVDTKVEEFFVDPKVHIFSQLSDHYGVSTTLRINKYPSLLILFIFFIHSQTNEIFN